MVHDDVAAGLASRGVEVFAKAGSTREEELTFFKEVLARRPEVVIDDRADVIRLAHTTHPEVLEDLIGASEETTSGVLYLRAMEADGTLKVPCIAADDEIDVEHLRAHAGESHMARDHVEDFAMPDGRSLYLVGAGVVVNLSAGEGHPAEIMDLTFSVQALSGAYLMQHGRDLEPKV